MGLAKDVRDYLELNLKSSHSKHKSFNGHKSQCSKKNENIYIIEINSLSLETRSDNGDFIQDNISATITINTQLSQDKYQNKKDEAIDLADSLRLTVMRRENYLNHLTIVKVVGESIESTDEESHLETIINLSFTMKQAL